jgi:hypothetical protein
MSFGDDTLDPDNSHRQANVEMMLQRITDTELLDELVRRKRLVRLSSGLYVVRQDGR